MNEPPSETFCQGFPTQNKANLIHRLNGSALSMLNSFCHHNPSYYHWLGEYSVVMTDRNDAQNSEKDTNVAIKLLFKKRYKTTVWNGNKSHTNLNTEQKAGGYCRSNLMPPIEICSDIQRPKRKVEKDYLILFSGPAGAIAECLNWTEVSHSAGEGFFFSATLLSISYSIHLCADTRSSTLITTQSRSATSVTKWKALNLPFFFFFCNCKSFTSERLLFTERPAESRPTAAARLCSYFILGIMWIRAQSGNKDLRSVYRNWENKTQHMLQGRENKYAKLCCIRGVGFMFGKKINKSYVSVSGASFKYFIYN